MIRKALLEDIEELNTLLERLFCQESEFAPNAKKQKRALKKIITSKKLGDIFVLEIDKEIVAMVNILYTYSTALGAKVALLEDMVVKEGVRQKGYGSKLLKGVLKAMKKKRVLRVTLLSDFDNENAHKFYENFGFKKSGMIVMRK
jgi:N-acetylglutamate synthase-like GNAT family acetyltransferase